VETASERAGRGPESMVILGIDPGSRRTGYGAIAVENGRCQLRERGVVVMPLTLTLEQKLREIHTSILALLGRLRPDVLAVEDIFHAVNSRTALVLGHVRGVVLLAGAEAGLPVCAYPPATVKLEVAGSGRAEKRQVAYMVARHLGLTERGDAGDAADALAVALCHALRRGNGGAGR
jgi:crossover junction endodeoxyribonuclease RuvC